MEKTTFEIERKFLIAMPKEEWLIASANEIWEIEQTYLLAEQGESARVRKIITKDTVQYVLTVKRRISDIKREETEREISRGEYDALLQKADPMRKTICKTRYRIRGGSHIFEIDVFPFWKDRAFLEVELLHEEETFSLPDGVYVLREVTEDRRYTNASLAREIPE